MRRAARKDTVHAEIVEGLQKAGIVVFDCSGLAGLGFDIVCYDSRDRPIGNDREWLLAAMPYWRVFEIKNPEPVTRSYKSSKRNLQPKETRQLTASEVKARSKAPIPCIRTIAEALSYF